MKLTDIIRRAGRSLRSAKARTALTSLAIGVGAFTITLALAAGEGGRQYAADIISSNTDVRELFVQPKIDNDAMNPTKPREYTEGPAMQYGGGFSQKMLSETDIKKLAELDHVTQVTPIYNASALYVTRQGQKKYQAGIEPYNSAITSDVLAGSTRTIANDQVVLPSTFADVLDLSGDRAIGQTIDVVMANSATGQRKTFRLAVVAITKSSALSVATSTTLQVSRDTVAEMYKFSTHGTPLEDAYIGAQVLADSEQDVEQLQQTIKDEGYDAQTAEDLMSFMFQFINVLMGVLIGFGALAVLTSVFGIINTQYISVLERTQQIGLMKALGARRRDIGRLFKLEAAWIGFLGGALGVGGAWLAGMLANPWISDKLSLGDARLLIFQPLMFLVVIAGLMLVAIGSGILPARKAAKLDPIEALRTE